MSKIDSLDFAEYVNNQKDKLYKHCVDNNINVNKDNSLDSLIDSNSLINNPEENKIRVRVIDYDGTLLDTQYYNIGDEIPLPPDPIPNDDRLIFKEWIYAVNSLIAEKDFDFGATYSCKEKRTFDDQELTPTIFDCYFDEEYTGLNPTIRIYQSNAIGYIDWGDGSELSMNDKSSAQTYSHIYANSGNYSIKIYFYKNQSNASFYFFTGSSNYLLGSQKLNLALNKAIITDITRFMEYTLYYCKSLKSVILDDTNWNSDYQGTSNSMNYCQSLGCVMWPKKLVRNSSGNFDYCYNLKYVCLPYGIVEIYNLGYTDRGILTEVAIPDTLTYIHNMQYISDKKLTLQLVQTYAPSFNYSYNIEYLDLSKCSMTQSTSVDVFRNLVRLKTLKLSNTWDTYTQTEFSGCTSLKELTIPRIPSYMHTRAFTGTVIENLIIPSDWNRDLDFIQFYTLSTDSWIDIISKLKDLNNESSKVITMWYGYYNNLRDIYVNSLGIKVDKDSDGAISIWEYIKNKNWTVSIVNTIG